MNFIKTKLEGVYIIEPKLFKDKRGYFLESFNQKLFEKNIGKINFLQDNESMSSRGVIRGLHFQNPPFDQAKLVRCVKGIILDVVVDLRLKSETYGKHISVELSGDTKNQLFIPKGFAHGFSVLSEKAIFSYKVDNFYAATHDSGIRIDDPDLNIDWRLGENEIKISEKDKNLPFLRNFQSPFKN